MSNYITTIHSPSPVVTCQPLVSSDLFACGQSVLEIVPTPLLSPLTGEPFCGAPPLAYSATKKGFIEGDYVE